ncbi:hypothetical protein CMI44_01010 [Candidatus Pacearchaeota archaeon]|nr:hypothetical protein [Candidatus Pacearchaeota archaeon]|tara:strand:- start:883 stop:1122 length:240 start_codon:yes stop_codon:yes gene_type:complete
MKIKVRVKPNSEEQSVEKISSELFSEKGFDGLYFVRLKSSVEEGKANLELIKVLVRYFGREVKIKSGFTSRTKIVWVED